MLNFNLPVKLVWGNEEDGYKEVAICANSQEADVRRKEYMAEIMPKFKSYYLRSWLNSNGEQMIDYGSHINFFKLIPSTN